MLDRIIGVNEAAEITGLSPGTIKNYCANGRFTAKKIGSTWILDIRKLEEEYKMTKAWVRETYTVIMVDFDGDLKEFEVVRGDETLTTITPDSIEAMDQIIEDLNNGEDVDGWEDGNGNTISTK